MKPFYHAEPIMETAPKASELAEKFGFTEEQAKDVLNDIMNQTIVKNDVYQVSMKLIEEGQVMHLSIKRIDRETIHDWRDLQTIKNMLVGPSCEAIEIYPAEDRLVDTANQYHLWVFTDPTYRIPLGFQKRCVSDATLGLAKNRPFYDNDYVIRKEKP